MWQVLLMLDMRHSAQSVRMVFRQDQMATVDFDSLNGLWCLLLHVLRPHSYGYPSLCKLSLILCLS